MILVGVDGGGTKTAAAAYEDGRLLRKAAAGPMNYNYIGIEAAAGNLLEAIRALEIPLEKIAAVGIGDPSIDEGMPEGKLFRQFAEAIRQKVGIPVFIRSDAYITLFGLTGGRMSSVLTLSGTGAMSIAENAAGEILTVGGWGRLTGDEGSGYFIAQEAIRAALMAADGVGPETALTRAVMEYFNVSTPRELIHVFYGEHCPEIAGFAKIAAHCADEGDDRALMILSEAAKYLAAYTSRLITWSESRTVGVYGSVICKNRIVRREFERLLHERFEPIRIIEPPVSATGAAALYAGMMLEKTEKENGHV